MNGPYDTLFRCMTVPISGMWRESTLARILTVPNSKLSCHPIRPIINNVRKSIEGEMDDSYTPGRKGIHHT